MWLQQHRCSVHVSPTAWIHFPRLSQLPLLNIQPATYNDQCWAPKTAPFLEETNLPLGRKLTTSARESSKGQKFGPTGINMTLSMSVPVRGSRQPHSPPRSPFKAPVGTAVSRQPAAIGSFGVSLRCRCSCPKALPFLGQPALGTVTDGDMKTFQPDARPFRKARLHQAHHWWTRPLLNPASLSSA